MYAVGDFADQRAGLGVELAIDSSKIRTHSAAQRARFAHIDDVPGGVGEEIHSGLAAEAGDFFL